MARPIFIAQFSKLPSTKDDADMVIAAIRNKLEPEYHVLVVFEDRPLVGTIFKLFSDKEIEPIEIERLKEQLNYNPCQENNPDTKS